MSKLLKYSEIFESATQSAHYQPGKIYGGVGGYKSKEEFFGKPEDKKEDISKLRIKYSKELEETLKELEEANNYVAFELLWLGEPTAKYYNGLKIEDVNISKVKNCFDVTIGGKVSSMLIANYIRFYFKGLFNPGDINEFLRMYNSVLSGEPVDGNLIKVEEFKYDPTNVRRTFLSLCTKTYPHGHEDEVLQFLPKLEKDIVGNYYKIIGDSKPETMFTCHLDTADRQQKVTKLYTTEEKGDEFIITDGNSILGADDKAGTTVMLYMMANNIPGLYYFFIGEERGGIGSGLLSSVFDDVDYLKNIKRCVSFDRRNYHSVITQQLGRVCCSNEFGTALCKEYNSNGLNLSLDPTGIYTDSASFLEQIPECTNVSVGYMHEHTADEFQNISYLERLCKASVKVNWNSLPTVRKVGLDEEIVRKHKPLINDIKKYYFPLDTKVVGESGGGVSIRVDLEDSNIEDIYESLTSLQVVLNKYKIEQNVFFDETYIKIELK
jgi:hypothetical protein